MIASGYFFQCLLRSPLAASSGLQRQADQETSADAMFPTYGTTRQTFRRTLESLRPLAAREVHQATDLSAL